MMLLAYSKKAYLHWPCTSSIFIGLGIQFTYYWYQLLLAEQSNEVQHPSTSSRKIKELISTFYGYKYLLLSLSNHYYYYYTVNSFFSSLFTSGQLAFFFFFSKSDQRVIIIIFFFFTINESSGKIQGATFCIGPTKRPNAGPSICPGNSPRFCSSPLFSPARCSVLSEPDWNC